MTARIFSPIHLGGLELDNRIVIAPMCQYSAVDGCMTDWHQIHLGHLALSGAALLTIEATAVTPEGRITYGDVGLWSDACEDAMAGVLETVRRWSSMPVAIQLAHAGRKASTEKPWMGGAQIPPEAPNGWRTQAPSAVPFAPDDAPPMALTRDDLQSGRLTADRAAQQVGRRLPPGLLHHSHSGLLPVPILSGARAVGTDADQCARRPPGHCRACAKAERPSCREVRDRCKGPILDEGRSTRAV